MAFRPPSGASVVLDFGGVYIPPDGDAVELDFANAAIWTTLTAGVSLALLKTQTPGAQASAYVVQQGLTRTCGASAYLAMPRTLTTGADFVVPGAELLTAGAGAAVLRARTATVGASVCIGVPRALVAGAGFAELGLRRTVATAVDFMPAGIEPLAAGGLLLKALGQSTAASAYVAVSGLTRTVTVDAKFSEMRRCYAGSAVQGTTGRTTGANALMSRAGMTRTTGTGAALQQTQQRPLGGDAAVQGGRWLQVGVSAPLGRLRLWRARCEAMVGAVYTTDLAAGALVRQALGVTLAGSAVLQRAGTRRVAASTAVQRSGRTLTVGLEAVLRVVPASEAVDADTPFDDEWEPLPRAGEWVVDGRPVEYGPAPRASEWILK